MNLNKLNAKNKNINFLIQNIISNLAKIKKERLKNAIRIGIRFHPTHQQQANNTFIQKNLLGS
jgi:hypothetical protein